jgi:S-adenosylmethionine uptake transporter
MNTELAMTLTFRPALSGNQRGFLLISLAMFCYTGMNACIKALGAVPESELMFIRAAGSALALGAAVLAFGVRRTLSTRRVGLHLARVLLGALGAWSWTYAAQHLPLAEVTVLALATPLWMLPLGQIMLGERAVVSRWLGVLIGFAGVWAMAGAGSSALGWAWLVALVAALLDALMGILLKQATTTDSVTGIQFWTMFGQVLVFAGLGGSALPQLAHWPALLGMVTLSVASGVLFSFGYRAGEASAVEPGCFNALPLAALLGYWRFGEVPTLGFWWGSLLLLAGLLLVLFGPARLAAEPACSR